MTAHPVVGVLTPSAFAITHPEIAVDFDEFDTGTVCGLARVAANPGERLDILAISSYVKGGGDGGRFLAAAVEAYRHVRVYAIENDRLRAMLARRGFTDFIRMERGEPCTGMEWRRP
jgi:hypothetical protein